MRHEDIISINQLALPMRRAGEQRGNLPELEPDAQLIRLGLKLSRHGQPDPCLLGSSLAPRTTALPRLLLTGCYPKREGRVIGLPSQQINKNKQTKNPLRVCLAHGHRG